MVISTLIPRNTSTTASLDGSGELAGDAVDSLTCELADMTAERDHYQKIAVAAMEAQHEVAENADRAVLVAPPFLEVRPLRRKSLGLEGGGDLSGVIPDDEQLSSAPQ